MKYKKIFFLVSLNFNDTAPFEETRQLFFKIKAMRYLYLFLITLLFNVAVKISKSKYLLVKLENENNESKYLI